jgi:hypothetical protein
VANQLWVLQVVGSNPAAPTNKIAHFLHFNCRQSSQKSALGRPWEAHKNNFRILSFGSNFGRAGKETETLKPPIFSMRPTGTSAQQYLHRAIMFRDAATRLPDYSNGEQYWPKYALLTHAIELSLKAFVQHSVDKRTPVGKEPQQHDLLGWYRLALQYGLADEPTVARNLDLLNQLHLTHYTRYPQDRTAAVPDASAIADTTVDHLIFAFTQTIYPR